jgi:hypothetical protein
MFDNDNLGPFVLLWGKDFLDLFLVVRPFGQLTIERLELVVEVSSKRLTD